MSIQLFSKRVYWDGRKGEVSFDGVYRKLAAPPVFRGISEIDYSPALGCMQLRPMNGKMREMWGSEIAAVEAYLNSLRFGGAVCSLRDLDEG